MCVLLIGVDVHPDHRLIVAANRDELLSRASEPPRVHQWNGYRVLAPRDVQAGGTWEGISETGLFVVITNRPDGDFDPTRPSRGELCRGALTRTSANAVRDWIEDEVRSRRYNSFNLFYADARATYVASWNGTLNNQSLGAGVHVLSNLHPLGELDIPEVRELPDDAAAVRVRFVEVLASHRARDARNFRICKHGTRYGTVSSSLLYSTVGGGAVLEHAAGAPCRTAFETFQLDAPT